MDDLTLHVKSEYDLETNKAVASTSVVDRQGEIIDQSGWELKNFKKNPVLLWAHDHSQPAIGTAKNIKVEGDGKKAQLTFTPEFNGVTDLSKAIKTLFEGTDEIAPQLNSFSVGFQPIESEGNTYTKQELLEISAVNVPANPEARTLAIKALKGVVDDKIAKGIVDSMTEKATDPTQSAYNSAVRASAAHEITQAHLQDLIAILGTALGYPGGDNDNDSELVYGEPGKEFKADIEKRFEEINEQIDDVVKGLKHLNPQVDRQVTVKRLHSAKVVAKAADKILARNGSQVEAKVAKRAAEKLIASYKQEI